MARWIEEEERLESSTFVGRKWECEQFRRLLDHAGGGERLLNVTGTGGIGKSRLLRQYGFLARERGTAFLTADFRDFAASPEAFESRLLRELGAGEGDAAEALNLLADGRPVVLAIDSYDKGAAIEQWLRESFAPRLDGRILLVIAGRYPLDGGWLQSAYWRSRIVKQPLESFTELEVREFLAKHGMTDETYAAKVYAWSGGLPAALGMLPPGDAGRKGWPDLAELSGRWLWETADESLRRWVEQASVTRMFNRELLGRMEGTPPTDDEFRALTRLSFVSSARMGWYLQDGVREAIQASFRKSRPAAFRESRRKCVAYYAELLKGPPQDDQGWILQELLYHVSDSMLRSVFAMAGSSASRNRLETLDESNYEELRAFLDRRKNAPRLKRNRYFDREKETVYTLEMTEEQDGLRARLVDPADWLALGLDSVKLLRSPDGEIVGLLVVIPIHRNTLEMLSERPVTRAYFASLTLQERLALAVPPEKPAGWFIRMIDVADPADGKTRTELLHAAFGYLASGGRLFVSTHLPFYQELVRRIGFEEAAGAEHFDYGREHLAATYELDIRGEKLKAWLNRISPEILHDSPDEPLPPLRLTEREQDIARLLLDGKTNPEIARTLYLSEITVKKYISQMLRKTDCSNRAQLIKVLLTRHFESH